MCLVDDKCVFLLLAVESVVVLEGSGVKASAHTTSDWVESKDFEPLTTDPIFKSADSFTKTPATLSRVGVKSG